MEKDKKEILEDLRKVKENATQDLNKREGYETSVIQNVKYLGEIALVKKETSEPETFHLYVVEEYDYATDELSQKIYLDGHEVNLQELLQDYENIQPIQDSLENMKKLALEKERESERIYDLNQMEREEREEYEKIAGVDKGNSKKILEFDDQELENEKEPEKEETLDGNKVQSINTLQEMQASTKVNNYQTLAGVLQMQGVKKFVVVYSEDASKIANKDAQTKSRNNSTYSVLAVKNDGTALNIDDKLELTRSEGTNSTEGRLQTDADGTTREEYHQASIFKIKGTENVLSIENDNHGEIQVYYGSMTKGVGENEGNRFVGTQIETRTVWPTSGNVRAQEDFQKGNRNADYKMEEAREHLDHGDETIENIKNADGDLNTKGECERINDDVIARKAEEIREKNPTVAEAWSQEKVEKALRESLEKHPERDLNTNMENVEQDLEDFAEPERDGMRNRN